jgi:hypothetical protein
VLVRERQRRAATALGLEPPARGRTAIEAALAAIAFASLAVCAATPVLWHEDGVSRRTDAEAYVFVDTSSSMLARRTVESPDRLDVARARARALAATLPATVPVGLVAFNDQPLPLLAPTVNRDAFRETLAYADVSVPTSPSFMIAAEEGSILPGRTARASNFSTLLVAAVSRFYAPATTHRLLFLVTDDDTADYDATGVGRLLSKEHITLVVLRVGSPADRLFYRSEGGRIRVDDWYAFDRRHARLLARTAGATGGRFFEGGGSVSGAVSFARRELGAGRQEATDRLTVRRDPRDLSLIPALTAFAALLALFVLLGLDGLLSTPPAHEARSPVA